MTSLPPAFFAPVPINEAEAIAVPLFDPALHAISLVAVHSEEDPETAFQQSWDSCFLSGRGREAVMDWNGSIPLLGYDRLRLSAAFSEDQTLRGEGVIDGRRIALFPETRGGKAPVEITSIPLAGLGAEVSELRFFLSSRAGEWRCTFYWVGLVDSRREPALAAPLPYPKQWKGFLDPAGKAGIARPWIGAPSALGRLKGRLAEPRFAAVRSSLEREARAWENYEPEPHLRSYIPVDENCYRYVRVRDRNRPLWCDGVTVLALGGFLLDRPEWSRRAGRLLLCMAFTPHWFEGPQGHLPGSGWHHVCFAEAHNLVAALFALQFMGDILTPAARKRVADKAAEVWPLVDRLCAEPGYRWHMNQGVVFNAARLAGAAGLLAETGEPRYLAAAFRSGRDFDTVLGNYLAADGYCSEGPGYFAYSLQSAIAAWMARAALEGKSIEEILPERVRRSAAYAEAVSAANCPSGAYLSLGAAAQCEWPVGLLLLMGGYGPWKEGGRYLAARMDRCFEGNPLSAWDVLLLLHAPDRLWEGGLPS